MGALGAGFMTGIGWKHPVPCSDLLDWTRKRIMLEHLELLSAVEYHLKL